VKEPPWAVGKYAHARPLRSCAAAKQLLNWAEGLGLCISITAVGKPDAAAANRIDTPSKLVTYP